MSDVFRREEDLRRPILAFAALSFGVAAVGALATVSSVRVWYPTLAKPDFTPPNWLFGPVWTLLYAMIAVVGVRLWRRRARGGARAALTAWGVQLALNLGWSLLFFGAKLIDLALAEILALDLAILVTLILAWRVDRLSTVLLLPYLGWCGFASALNLAIARLN